MDTSAGLPKPQKLKKKIRTHCETECGSWLLFKKLFEAWGALERFMWGLLHPRRLALLIKGTPGM